MAAEHYFLYKHTSKYISNIPKDIPSDPLSNFSKKMLTESRAATANPSFSRAFSKESLNASKVLARK
jgi:hypothetical protein